MRRPDWLAWLAVVVTGTVMLFVGMGLARGEELVMVPKAEIERIIAQHNELVEAFATLQERFARLWASKVTCA